MANLIVKNPPEYNDEIEKLTTEDRAHADTFNAKFEALLSNEAYLKEKADGAETHQNNAVVHVTAQDKEAWNAKASTSVATQSANGLQSAEDKKKLDNIATGAEVNQNAYTNVKVGNVTVVAAGKTSTLTLEAGDNITLTADNSSKKVTIKANRDGGNAATLGGRTADQLSVSNADTVDNVHFHPWDTSGAPNGHGYVYGFNGGGDCDAYVFPTTQMSVNYADSAGAVSWNNVADKPSTFTPSSHTHDDYASKSKYSDMTINMGREPNTTVGLCSVAVGSYNVATGEYSYAEGRYTEASGNYSHAEGYNVTASGYNSHAEGGATKASGNYSHAEGSLTSVSGNYSHAGGYLTSVSGNYSHAEGYWTSAPEDFQYSIGKCNVKGTHAFAVGNGYSQTSGSITSAIRSNAFSVNFDGVVKAASTITGSTTADYAEFFEWADGNPDIEDRVGYFVTLTGDKIRIANSTDDYILGIISGHPCVLGNADCDTWTGMYLRDDFNRPIQEPAPKMVMEELTEEIGVEIPELDEETGETIMKTVKETIVTGIVEKEAVDQDGNPIYEGTRLVLNPEYNSKKRYISRDERPEWDAVGMLGVLAVWDDGTCEVNGYCKCNDSGIATKSETGYRVIARIKENIVKVVFR